MGANLGCCSKDSTTTYEETENEDGVLLMQDFIEKKTLSEETKSSTLAFHFGSTPISRRGSKDDIPPIHSSRPSVSRVSRSDFVLHSMPTRVYDADDVTTSLNFQTLKITGLSQILNKEDIHTLAHIMKRGDFEAYQCLYTQGELADGLGIVYEGAIALHYFDTDEKIEIHKQSSNMMRDLKASQEKQVSHIVPGHRKNNSHSSQYSFGLDTIVELPDNENLITDISASRPSYLCSKNKTQFFGSELFFPEKIRKTCAISTMQTTVLFLFEEDLQILKEKYPHILRALRTVCGADMRKVFSSAAFLKEEKPNIRDILLLLLEYHHYDAGKVLFEEGDSSADQPVFFVQEGKLRIYLTLKDDEEKELVVLSNGATIGEVSLVLDVKRTASCATLTDVVLHQLPRKLFYVFTKLAPSVVTHFKNHIRTFVMPLATLIENPQFLSYFIRQCETEFSTENISFWIKTGEYIKHYNERGSVENVNEAKEIYKEFLSEVSPSQVNLISTVVLPLRTKFDTTQHIAAVGKTVFDDARKEILKLMSSDSYNRFRRSDLWEEYIESLGGGTEKEVSVSSKPSFSKSKTKTVSRSKSKSVLI